MNTVAQLKTPLRSVDRGPKGTQLGGAKANMNGVALGVTLTEGEIHIGWVDRKGPTFVIELNEVVQAAVTEIEILLGQRKEGTL